MLRESRAFFDLAHWHGVGVSELFSTDTSGSGRSVHPPVFLITATTFPSSTLTI
jgi:hypothetical protein